MSTTTGDPTGTSGETETETETTGDGVCEIELPDPGSCDAGPPAPAPKRPNLVLGSPRAALAPATAAPALGAAVAVHDGCNFIDCGEEPSTCDIYLQDCPEGEKCNPWVSGGGSSWNSTKCVPIAEEPDPIGGPCTVEGSGVSGVDSCEAGAMCWGVDGDTGIGTCIAHCTCSSDNPICTVANTTCAIANDGILNLCLPVCDPLDPSACESGDLCVTLGDYFICVLDASGGTGTAGTPCNFANACNPGLACLNNQFWPDCQDTSCCVPFCDLSDASCPSGTSCIPWYDVGQEPKCYENVGVCIQ